MKCKGLKDGKPCEAEAMKDSEFCYWHNPKTEQERKQASKAGGEVSYYDKGLVKAEPIDIITDRKAIIYLLADTVNRVRRISPNGSIDIKVANCIGFLSSKIIEAQKEIVTAERLDKLEKILNEKG